MATSPDIVLFVLDTQRADRLSCYGYPEHISPHIDAFAGQSIRFNQAISPAQWTLPTHASLFTGLYPSQHKMTAFGMNLTPEIPTLAGRLEQAGYYTAAFSNNPLIGLARNGLERGFRYISNYHHGERSTIYPSTVHRVASVEHLFKRLKRYTQNQWGRLQKRLRQDETVNSQSLQGNTSQTLNDIGDLLINRPGVQSNQPIFAFVNLMGTHPPYAPPEWALNLVQDSLKKETLDHINHTMLQDYGWLDSLFPQSLDSDQVFLLNKIYNAEVRVQDSQFGAFMQGLHQAKAFDNTLFILVADHGDHLGEKQMLGHAAGVYQELVHVPLIIHDPTDRQPGISQEIVSTRRIFHTILTFACLAEAEEKKLSLLDFQSQSSENFEPEPVFAEAVPVQRMVSRLNKKSKVLDKTWPYDMMCQAIFLKNHKLIKTGGENFALYNLNLDPQEQADLSRSEPELFDELKEMLATFNESAKNYAAAFGQASDMDDDLLQERLRDLGYLE